MAEEKKQKNSEGVLEGTQKIVQTAVWQPAEEAESANKAEELFDAYKRARTFTERKWYLYYQFFRGNQWLDINRVTGELFVPPAPSWRVRLVINKTWTIIRNVATMITDKRPTWDVLPGGDSPEDVQNARLIRQCIEYLYDKLGIQDKIEELVYYMLIFGVGYLKVGWDGKEIFIEVCDPFSIYFDPLAKDPESAAGVIHAVPRTLDYIKKHYGVDVEADNVLTTSMIQQRMTSEMSGFPIQFIQPSGSQVSKSEKDKPIIQTAMLKEGFFKDEDGNWRIITWAGSTGKAQHLKSRAHPYKHGKCSIIKIVANRVPGEWLGISEIENLLPLQKELNKSRSQVVEHKNLLSRGKWLNPKNSGIPDNAFTSEPGEVITYNPGAKPEQADIKPLPEYVLELMQWVERQMEDISGVHEVSMGRIPVGAKSGKAIEALKESDEVSIRPKERNLEMGLEKVGYQMVGLMQQYYTSERLIKITENEQPKYFKFSAENIKEGYDIRVNLDTAFAYTRMGRREELQRLFELGAIGRKTLLKHYEFSNVEEALREFSEEGMSEQARRRRQRLDQEEEINTLLKGQEALVEETDDHEQHTQVLEEYIRTHRREIAEYPDEVLAALEAHLAKHYEMMAQLQGAPGGTGAAAGGQKGTEAPQRPISEEELVAAGMPAE